jgi:hypothetical protein
MKRWNPTVREMALIRQYARATQDTPDRVAGYFRGSCPIRVREIMQDARRGR